MPGTLATDVAQRLARPSRWTPLEIAFWLAAVAAVWLLPSKHLILTEIAILALFALSLDLILGYAGIVSLGHAAFFGFGAYLAGVLAKNQLIAEPVLALVLAGLAAALLLGIADVMGKYYVPKLGAFIVYTLMILILLARPQGLFSRAGAAR